MWCGSNVWCEGTNRRCGGTKLNLCGVGGLMEAVLTTSQGGHSLAKILEQFRRRCIRQQTFIICMR